MLGEDREKIRQGERAGQCPAGCGRERRDYFTGKEGLSGKVTFGQDTLKSEGIINVGIWAKNEGLRQKQT